MNIFEIAARKVFRFPSMLGQLSTEQLFQLPLTSQRGASLDDVGKRLLSEQRATQEESLIDNPDTSAASQDLATKIEIVKFVIADVQETAKAARVRAEKRARRAKLLEALENREAADLAGKSREEILKELEED